MRVSIWNLFKTSEDETHVPKGNEAGNAFGLLIVLAVAVLIAAATMFASDYASIRQACAVHAGAGQC